MDRERKYVTRAFVADDCAFEAKDAPRSMMVLTDDDEPIDTGIVNADGVKIFRVRERHPIGFAVKR